MGLPAWVPGFAVVREIFAAKAFGPYFEQEFLPGPGVNSDAEYEQFLRFSALPAYHPVGTCKMGIDDEAVVDPELRVRGMQGLRVVDASIMPTLVSGNTNAPTIMIAEKAAAMILGESEARAAA